MIGIVRDTIGLRRAYDCERNGLHVWTKLNDTEDQCTNCQIIVTEDGKKNLTRMTHSFFGTRP